MILSALAWASLALASIPASMTAVNLLAYRRAPRPAAGVPRPFVSVLIPARNEEDHLEGILRSVFASEGVDLDVVVLDDHSEDRTAAIAREFAQRDPRLRFESAPPLRPGWCGKQHACDALSKLAKAPRLLFVDADVRLAPDAIALMAAFQDASRADLVSGFPRQETGTFLESLLIPLIPFVLLGFLPIPLMRRFRHPAFGAGCGQLFLAHRGAYGRAGGHEAIKTSLHDGVTLPRAFRRAGLRTDLFDASDIAYCRMYRGAAETWRGLSKNATEGMASPAAIGPWTLLLAGGQVLPFLLLVAAPSSRTACAAAALALAARLAVDARVGQAGLITLLHPAGIGALLAIQYGALARRLSGKSATWKGRAFGGGPGA